MWHTYTCTIAWVKEWVNERVSEWKSEWVKEWVSERVREWVSERVSEWKSEWFNQQTSCRVSPTQNTPCRIAPTHKQHHAAFRVPHLTNKTTSCGIPRTQKQNLTPYQNPIDAVLSTRAIWATHMHTYNYISSTPKYVHVTKQLHRILNRFYFVGKNDAHIKNLKQSKTNVAFMAFMAL